MTKMHFSHHSPQMLLLLNCSIRYTYEIVMSIIKLKIIWCVALLHRLSIDRLPYTCIHTFFLVGWKRLKFIYIWIKKKLITYQTKNYTRRLLCTDYRPLFFLKSLGCIFFLLLDNLYDAIIHKLRRFFAFYIKQSM